MPGLVISTRRLPRRLHNELAQQRLLGQLQRIAQHQPMAVLAALQQAEQDQHATTRRVAR